MNNSTICPLSIGRAFDPAPCLKEHCSWWHTYTRDGNPDSRCALVSIADSLTDMNIFGVDILGIEYHND